MSEIENYFSEQISPLIPYCEKMEVRAKVSVSSFSIEFFATINGTRYQCYDMADQGLLSEKKLDAAFKSIANYIRKSDQFDKEKLNKYSFTLYR